MGIAPPSLNTGDVSANGPADDDATGSDSVALLEDDGATEAAAVVAVPAADGTGDAEAGDPDDAWQLATRAAKASQTVKRIRADAVISIRSILPRAADDPETTETYRRLVRCLSA
jgi:hypothetical protein